MLYQLKLLQALLNSPRTVLLVQSVPTVYVCTESDILSILKRFVSSGSPSCLLPSPWAASAPYPGDERTCSNPPSPGLSVMYNFSPTLSVSFPHPIHSFSHPIHSLAYTPPGIIPPLYTVIFPHTIHCLSEPEALSFPNHVQSLFPPFELFSPPPPHSLHRPCRLSVAYHYTLFSIIVPSLLVAY